MNYYRDAFTKKFADFDGRARRLEFWTVQRINIYVGIGMVVLAIGASTIHPKLGVPVLAVYGMFSTAWVIPGLALSVRRLHDTGKSGVWILLAFVPLGAFLLLVFFVTDGDRGTNEFGPDPKRRTRRVSSRYEDDDEDDDYRPRRRGRDWDDDDDEDDYDDRPRRRGRSDDDEDDRPRRRRR